MEQARGERKTLVGVAVTFLCLVFSAAFKARFPDMIYPGYLLDGMMALSGGGLLISIALWARLHFSRPKNPKGVLNRLVIEYRPIFPGTPIRHPVHMLHLIMAQPEQGGGGLGVIGGAGETSSWPSMRYECDVINYGDAALINVEMSVGLVWRDAVRTANGMKQGDVTFERMWPFTIGRIEPGPSNKFTFYILNTPDHIVSVGFWPEAQGQRVDRSAPEGIPVTVTKGLPIVVFPLLETEKGVP